MNGRDGQVSCLHSNRHETMASFIVIMTGWTNKQHVRTSDLQIHLRSSVSVFLIKSPVGNEDERSDTLSW